MIDVPQCLVSNKMRYTRPPLSKEYFVYEMADPDTHTPFYVGVGSRTRSDGAFRPNDHIRSAMASPKNGNRHRNYKIMQIIETGRLPALRIVFESDVFKAVCQEERRLIAQYGRRDIGNGCLVNMTDGGDGSNNWASFTDEKREAIRQKIRSSITPEMRERSRNAVIAANTGRKDTADTIRRRVENSRGKTMNYGPDNGTYGKARPQHVKDAVSRANRGRVEPLDKKQQRQAHLKERNMTKHIGTYQAVMARLDAGMKCKEIVSELGISHDVVTKVRKEWNYIMELISREP